MFECQMVKLHKTPQTFETSILDTSHLNCGKGSQWYPVISPLPAPFLRVTLKWQRNRAIPRRRSDSSHLCTPNLCENPQPGAFTMFTSKKWKKRFAKTLGLVHKKKIELIEPLVFNEPNHRHIGFTASVAIIQIGDMLFFVYTAAVEFRTFMGFHACPLVKPRSPIRKIKGHGLPIGCSRSGLFMAQLRFFHKKTCF